MLSFISPVSIALGVLCLILLALFWRERRTKKKQVVQAERDVLDRLHSKGFDVLQSAIQRSQEILGQAALEEMQMSNAAKSQNSVIQQTIERNLTELTNKTLQDFGQKMENNEAIIRQQINKLFENFEQNLSNFLTQTEQKSVNSIDLELQATRQLIDTYKQQQLTLIDENIIAMLERTLSLVLSKKLSLKDQSDLVYEALERAKIEKFIA